MIAGYTSVANAKWGVMVPQPVSELQNKAQRIDEMAAYVMLLGLGLAILLSIPVSFILVNPLEQLNNAIRRIERGDSKNALNVEMSRATPIEIQALKHSFITMMNNVELKESQISNLAYFDSHTKLPNRNYFNHLSLRVLSEMAPSKSQGALVFIDFDDFKLVNDNYGHQVGDDLLFSFAKRLVDYFSIESHSHDLLPYFNTLPEVIPARLGGDEFVILIRNVNSINEIELMIQGLFKQVFSTYHCAGHIEINLTGSAGITLFSADGTQFETLMQSADMAMYEAKSKGKNRIHVVSIR
jgi:diguanylate cyclase (GGDEF)-like protein